MKVIFAYLTSYEWGVESKIVQKITTRYIYGSKKMEQENIDTCGKKAKKTIFWKLFLWIVPALFLILLAGFVVIRIYLVPQDDSSGTSQMTGLVMLIAFIMVIFVFMVVRFHYLEIRYIQIPVWRWMASGFKGEPKLPFPRFSWATKSARAEAKSKMNKKQRACIWLGNICSFVGMILMINRVVWRCILIIKGESTIESVSLTLFWVGTFMFFTGICVSGLVYQRILKTQPLQKINENNKNP